MDISYLCEICVENECLLCELGNPCLGCGDYDKENNKCLSNGGCAGTDKSDMV